MSNRTEKDMIEDIIEDVDWLKTCIEAKGRPSVAVGVAISGIKKRLAIIMQDLYPD